MLLSVRACFLRCQIAEQQEWITAQAEPAHARWGGVGSRGQGAPGGGASVK